MLLLCEEVEKLFNNEFEQGVIEIIIDCDDLFVILFFMKINLKVYLYNCEKMLSEVIFIDVNDIIFEGVVIFEECVVKLCILVGDVDVDKFLVIIMVDINNQLVIQVCQKVKGLVCVFCCNLILGDFSFNNKVFDGILCLMYVDQKIDIVGVFMIFFMFDELVDVVKDFGVDCIMMCLEYLCVYCVLLCIVNVGLFEIMMENFGCLMLCYNGVLFIINDFILIDFGKVSIYCLYLLEENGVIGLYGGDNVGIVVENIGIVQNKDVVCICVKWYCFLVNKYDKVIVVLINVKI